MHKNTNHHYDVCIFHIVVDSCCFLLLFYSMTGVEWSGVEWTELDWTGVYACNQRLWHISDVFPVTPMRAELITSERQQTFVMCFRHGHSHAKLITSDSLQAFADLLTFVNYEHITRCESLVILCFLQCMRPCLNPNLTIRGE